MSEYRRLLVVAVAVADLDEHDDPTDMWPYWQAKYAIEEYVNSPAFSVETIKSRLIDIPDGPGDVQLLVAKVEKP